jgi:hypothetical protein
MVDVKTYKVVLTVSGPPPGSLTQTIRPVVNGESSGYMDLTPSRSNCKLSILDTVNGILATVLNRPEGEQKCKAIFEQIFRQYCRPSIYLTVNAKNFYEFFKNNFELYGVTLVPTGYGTTPLYHIIVRNTFTNNLYARPPLTPEAAEKIVIKNVDKQQFATVLTKTLKKYRRKTDVVEEIANSLFE